MGTAAQQADKGARGTDALARDTGDKGQGFLVKKLELGSSKKQQASGEHDLPFGFYFKSVFFFLFTSTRHNADTMGLRKMPQRNMSSRSHKEKKREFTGKF